ncbi:MAG TPA: uracil-DNA glycosylase [Bacteroidia bacterium]|jgi:uracil-DNA glycosylase|nr:uracil-DNA glycosylase [Bacteroidia bacterium]
MSEQVSINPTIEESWKTALKEEFNSEYLKTLKAFLIEERSKNIVYPPASKIFNAFNLTPLDKVKVVIIGQDPYHGAGQANGLCFSVSEGIPQPPSLQNIFKEINSDLGFPIPKSGNLEPWAKQGVLLLNATLTVRANQAGSHQKMGWEYFTDAVIKYLSDKKKGLVFLLWGKFAQAKEILIDKTKHHILKAAHPSPFSVHSGFFGCKHFSKTNEFLIQQGLEEVDWRIN